MTWVVPYVQGTHKFWAPHIDKFGSVQSFIFLHYLQVLSVSHIGVGEEQSPPTLHYTHS